MLSIILVLVPIFALILAGYVCRRRGVLGAHATSEINRMVVWLALPSLLFDIMANASWKHLYQPRFFLVFFCANLIVFGAILLAQRLASKHLVDASIVAMTAAYPNVGFIGFPLMLAVFGKDSLMPTTIATIVVVCILFALAISLIEVGLQVERHPRKLALKVGGALIRNPLILAPVLGALCAAAGVHVPASAEQFLKLMGGAASPCALVCIGLFLADQAGTPAASNDDPIVRPQRHAPWLLSLVKLVGQPALTWVFATLIMPLPADSRHMAVLLAALPTGTGPFMLAEYYRRNGAIASRVILVSTIASIASLAILMWAMGVVPA